MKELSFQVNDVLKKRNLVLLNLEPELDMADPVAARKALDAANFVVSLTPYRTGLEYADVLLPIAPFTETPGTFVSTEGRVQSFHATVNPLGDARPAWKVLRVLGNLLEAQGFDYESSEELRKELQATLGTVTPDNRYSGTRALPAAGDKIGPATPADVPMYGVDPVVRRARALQLTPEARRAAARGRLR